MLGTVPVQRPLSYQNGVELKLQGHTAPYGTTPRVLEPGAPGDPDSLRAIYYGSVHRVGDQLYMWYLGQDHDQGWFSRVCLATSRDGHTWHKPNLGLVEYKGSSRNNLVGLHQGHVHVQSCVVFHDPDAPDPARRFKMVYQTRIYDWRFAVAFSADGISWKPHPDNPVGYWLEMAGGMRFNDCYFLIGQGGNHARRLRNLVTYTCSINRHTSAPTLVIRSRLMRAPLHAPATRVRVEQSPPLSWFVPRAGP